MKRLFFFLTSVMMMLAVPACKHNNTPSVKEIETIADQVWAFSLSHPDGYTLDIRTMTEPTEGIAVSYAETQDSQGVLNYRGSLSTPWRTTDI